MHTHKLNMHSRTRHNAGFTLVEIAIALLVVTLLAGGAIGAVQVQLRYTKSSQAREQIREAREALLQYAVAKGVLPCPADDKDVGTPNCAKLKNFLPWRELGLPATDPWGQPLHYAVTANFTSNGFTYVTLGSLQVLSGGVDIDAAPKAVAFSLWSAGEDAADASESAGDTVVVAETPGSDDIIEWTSRYVLLGRLMNAGRLVPLGSGSSSSAASSAATSSASSS